MEVKSLTKNFGNFPAVKGISFDIPKGKIVGLLGPNGAGKTTTIHMLLGVTIPTSGTIKYFGKDFEKHKQYCLSRLNFTSTYNELQGRVTVHENLEVFGRLYSLKNFQAKMTELARELEITELMNKQYRDLSAGQMTRVNIVKSLLNEPDILLMDEPTASLDPDITDKMLSYIEKLNKERGLTILYTSHEMDEVTRVCDQVIIMNRGEIVSMDTPLNLTKKIEFCQLVLWFEGKEDRIIEYLDKKSLEHEFVNEFTVNIVTAEKDLADIIHDLKKIGISITDVEVNKPTLEDVFLQIARGTDESR